MTATRGRKALCTKLRLGSGPDRGAIHRGDPGTYFYARLRLRNVLKEIPNKIGIDIKQTANGFQFSKSDGKRTLFTVQAGKLKQFKLDESAELHNVSIVLYGRDTSRFDQIYGDDFTYDQKSGDVTAQGEVQIDLEANPAGGRRSST
jgi:lipopolysaccharide export system protein LptA